MCTHSALAMWSTCSSPCVALNCRQRRSRMSHSALHAALHTSLFAEQTTQANDLFPGCEATIQGCLRSRKRLVRLLPSALAESSLPAAKRLMTLEAGTVHKRSLTNSVGPSCIHHWVHRNQSTGATTWATICARQVGKLSLTQGRSYSPPPPAPAKK